MISKELLKAILKIQSKKHKCQYKFCGFINIGDSLCMKLVDIVDSSKILIIPNKNVAKYAKGAR